MGKLTRFLTTVVVVAAAFAIGWLFRGVRDFRRGVPIRISDQPEEQTNV